MRRDSEYIHQLRIHGIKPNRLKTRREALKSGDRYYLGNPCKHGHPGHRYTSNGRCMSCVVNRNCQSRHKPEKPSRMVEIDRLKDQQEPDYWGDL